MKETQDSKNAENAVLDQNAGVVGDVDGASKGTRLRKAAIVATILAVLALAVGRWATGTPSLPKTFEDAGKLPAIYPDYVGTTLPPNVAPLNFRVEEEGERYLTSVYSKNGAEIVVKGQNAQFPLKKWRALLEANIGETLVFDVY
ncbi:MAG: hypothetical protein IKY61_05490, partial [Thermoguttaceae bacterium]|nr:hypothetical protein [Thermoguttaceae bacterium]